MQQAFVLTYEISLCHSKWCPFLVQFHYVLSPPLFLAFPAQSSASDDTRPQHLSGIVGNYPFLSEVALFLDLEALIGSMAIGKLASTSLREHCG